MPYLSQEHAPIQEALERMKRARLVPFDVPGHKRGRGNPELSAFLGAACLDVDVNSMKMLDNLCHPVSVIKDAETLAAEAFRAAHAFFMVSGTTGSVQARMLRRRLRVIPTRRRSLSTIRPTTVSAPICARLRSWRTRMG